MGHRGGGRSDFLKGLIGFDRKGKFIYLWESFGTIGAHLIARNTVDLSYQVVWGVLCLSS